MEIKNNRLGDVIRNLALVRDKVPGHYRIRTLVLIPGGAVRGAAINAGQIAALTELGFGADIFRFVVGISSGAAVGAYFMTNDLAQIELGCKFVYERIPKYVHPNIVTHFGRVFDTPAIEGELKDGDYAPNLESILESPSNFYAGVMKRKTGEFLLLNAGDGLIFKKVRASMTIPWISRGKVFIGGTEFVDGGFYPFPLKDLIEEFGPTDILILSNKTEEQISKGDIVGKLAKPYVRKYSEEIRSAMGESREELFNLDRYENTNIGVIIPPDTGIDGLTRDPIALRKAIDISREHTRKIIVGLLR